MRTYTQLSNEQRYHISLQRKAGDSLRHIARQIGVSASTISRELRRNIGKKGYRPKQAHALATDRRSAAAQRCALTPFAWAFVTHKLEQKWSPEQIHGALLTQGWQGVPSHEHIYQYILTDKRCGGSLHTHLRAQKKRRKRYGSGQQRRGQLSDCKRIIEREPIVEQRSRVGDFEGDTLIGKNHQGAIVSLVDRKTLYTLIAVMPDRTANRTAQTCIALLKTITAHTVTFDNGKEFAQHQHIAQQAGVDIYFADPYHSNQRARNENTNGLIRQFHPKRSNFLTLTNLQIEHTMHALNHRPRKTQQWLTPAQAFAQNNLININSTRYY